MNNKKKERRCLALTSLPKTNTVTQIYYFFTMAVKFS